MVAFIKKQFNFHPKNMNPISITETAMEIAAKFPQFVNKKDAESARLLFIPKGYSLKYLDGSDFESEILPNVIPPPFPFFKFCIPSHDLILTGVGVFNVESGFLNLVFKVEKKFFHIRFNIKGEANFDLFADGKWIDLINERTKQLNPSVLVGRIAVHLSLFRNPLLMTVKASPQPKQGKSVEWVKAREYYTVIHRRHSANTKGAVERGTYGDDTLKRIAHARKAHFRILRSEKWGKNQGARVFVSATWVGPREWIDAESKQIYTIQRK